MTEYKITVLDTGDSSAWPACGYVRLDSNEVCNSSELADIIGRLVYGHFEPTTIAASSDEKECPQPDYSYEDIQGLIHTVGCILNAHETVEDGLMGSSDTTEVDREDLAGLRLSKRFSDIDWNAVELGLQQVHGALVGGGYQHKPIEIKW